MTCLPPSLLRVSRGSKACLEVTDALVVAFLVFSAMKNGTEVAAASCALVAEAAAVEAASLLLSASTSRSDKKKTSGVAPQNWTTRTPTSRTGESSKSRSFSERNGGARSSQLSSPKQAGASEDAQKKERTAGRRNSSNRTASSPLSGSPQSRKTVREKNIPSRGVGGPRAAAPPPRSIAAPPCSGPLTPSPSLNSRIGLEQKKCQSSESTNPHAAEEGSEASLLSKSSNVSRLPSCNRRSAAEDKSPSTRRSMRIADGTKKAEASKQTGEAEERKLAGSFMQDEWDPLGEEAVERETAELQEASSSAKREDEPEGEETHSQSAESGAAGSSESVQTPRAAWKRNLPSSRTPSAKSSGASTPHAIDESGKGPLCANDVSVLCDVSCEKDLEDGDEPEKGKSDEDLEDICRPRTNSASSVSSSSSSSSASTACSVSKEFDLRGLKARPPWWQDLVKRHVEGDGNCMFRAFSDQLYGTQDYHFYIRQMAVEVMRIKQSEFEPFIDEADGPSFEAYLSKIATAGEWADDRELRALSMLYDFSIEIYDDNFHVRKTFYEDEREDDPDGRKLTVRLIWSATPGHYSSVQRRSTPFPLSQDHGVGTLEYLGLRRLLLLEEQLMQQQESAAQLDAKEQRALAEEWGLDPADLAKLAQQQRQLFAEAAASPMQKNRPQKKAQEICSRIWSLFEDYRAALAQKHRSEHLGVSPGAGAPGGNLKAPATGANRACLLPPYTVRVNSRGTLDELQAGLQLSQNGGGLRVDSERLGLAPGECWRAASGYPAGLGRQDAGGLLAAQHGEPATRATTSGPRTAAFVLPSSEAPEPSQVAAAGRLGSSTAGPGRVAVSRSMHTDGERALVGVSASPKSGQVTSPFFVPLVGSPPYLSAYGEVETPARPGGWGAAGPMYWPSQQTYTADQVRLRQQYLSQQKVKQLWQESRTKTDKVSSSQQAGSAAAGSSPSVSEKGVSTVSCPAAGGSFMSDNGLPIASSSRRSSSVSTVVPANPVSPRHLRQEYTFQDEKVGDTFISPTLDTRGARPFSAGSAGGTPADSQRVAASSPLSLNVLSGRAVVASASSTSAFRLTGSAGVPFSDAASGGYVKTQDVSRVGGVLCRTNGVVTRVVSPGTATAAVPKSAAPRTAYLASLESDTKTDRPVSGSTPDPQMNLFVKSSSAKAESSLESSMMTSDEFARMFSTPVKEEEGSRENSREADPSFGVAWRKANGKQLSEGSDASSSFSPAFAVGIQPNDPRGLPKESSATQAFVPRVFSAGDATMPSHPWRLASASDAGVKHCFRRPDGVYVQVDPSQLMASYPVVAGAGFATRGGVPSGTSATGIAYARHLPHNIRPVAGLARKGNPSSSNNAAERNSGVGSLVSSDGNAGGVASTGSWIGNWLRHTASSR
ncbi:OTU family cysteine protease [Toxoplasma gondii GAB2-2007-GAL-DOM2]|uniref:OTU family cysteine protease n=5 Tax=Toxoplasma gondii TaxID=5811 RepID=S7UED7_TOXGG|nr:OTU family cysteine protease [Toxoplasma gondii GT1]KAF4643232.1 OTU family cysteine protease [Toxoplasma gondii]KFG33094.1 OTU family cysteine protease [Toxoplasma gondii GAB2-2007-GAL-DOM2]KFG51433.1 OTU family cysteine protease [Toxoplasma gondii FOU]RQX69123.1 OTU family cysteine protease [Toxoplasma gondii CAST]